MHNLHFIRVTAKSGEEACSTAESLISDYGHEDNWSTVCGAVSEDNEVYKTEEGRYEPDGETSTIDGINELVNKWTVESFYGKSAREKIVAGEVDFDKWDSHDLWSLSKYAEHLYHSHSFKNKKFDILTDHFYSGVIDECGVTECSDEGDDEGKIWIVFVDMHS